LPATEKYERDDIASRFEAREKVRLGISASADAPGTSCCRTTAIESKVKAIFDLGAGKVRMRRSGQGRRPSKARRFSKGEWAFKFDPTRPRHRLHRDRELARSDGAHAMKSGKLLPSKCLPV